MGVRLWFVAMSLLAVGVSTVTAESGASTDAQPGFGVLIAVVALLIAFAIARRKRRKARESMDGESKSNTAEPEFAYPAE